MERKVISTGSTFVGLVEAPAAELDALADRGFFVALAPEEGAKVVGGPAHYRLAEGYRVFLLEKTRSGRLALWEEGGGMTNTGSATVIADLEGKPLRPYYVRRRGQLANGRHALVPVRCGSLVVKANHHRRDFIVKVWEVVAIIPHTNKGPVAIAKLIGHWAEGEWVPTPPTWTKQAIEACLVKALCYHCRAPHFVKAPTTCWGPNLTDTEETELEAILSF